MCQSTNRAAGTTSGVLYGKSSLTRRAGQERSQPEVWFRVVHVGLHGQNPVSEDDMSAYREQIVEITLGPKGAFSKSNMGALRRRVKANKVVNAVPRQIRKPKLPKETRTPKVVELLRKAIEWQALIKSGEVPNQAAIARHEGITRARVTQIMGLLHLAPEIREHIKTLPDMVRRPAITERALRPIALLTDPQEQISQFHSLLA